MGPDTVRPTCHQIQMNAPRPALIPSKQASTWLTYPRETEGWVDLSVGDIWRWFTVRRQSPTQIVTKWLRLATRPESNPRPFDCKFRVLIVTPPRHTTPEKSNNTKRFFSFKRVLHISCVYSRARARTHTGTEVTFRTRCTAGWTLT